MHVAQQKKCEHVKRRIVVRMPLTDHEDFALPDGVPFFCIPESKMVAQMAAYERRPTFLSFVLTGGDGARAYGFALHYFQHCGNGSVVETALGWRPRVLCLISHHPFFSLFKEILSWMCRSRHSTTEDSAVQMKIARACEAHGWLLPPSIVHHASLSPYASCSNSRKLVGQKLDLMFGRNRGHCNKKLAIREEQYRVLSKLLQYTSECLLGKTLHIRAHGQSLFRYHVQRGKAVHMDDYCFKMLFQCLSLKNVIYVVNCLLLEQRVLVHSSYQGRLTPVCEALSTLLFPFCWKHVYIPFLPVELIEYLQAPVPYFIGLHTSSLTTRVECPQSASDVVNEVELTFGEGPLGITFEPTHLRLLAASNFDSKRQLAGSAVVKSLPRLLNGLAGPAEYSGLVSTGSYLTGINGHSTLDMTFEETIDCLQCTIRPIRLRFLNATLPHKNACNFADRLQALSLVSAMQATLENHSLPWVDTLRGAFAAMFASICRDYQRYINAHRQESSTCAVGRKHALPTTQECDRTRRRIPALSSPTQFDHESFCNAVPSNRRFLLEFTQTQCFVDFVNESVIDTQPRAGSTSYALFHECIHLVRESSDARAAILLLFERDNSPMETSVIDLF
ncbi:unnamed protein product [Hyaloperonospora brassicae]|uniref:UDENN domain-containing protein n=1 Tax=Hyaloperonospora brassicae TaxID=162125 RepID=A0AAV0TCF7_HYABA|nr:unnamed protein product [Hyaloperonospora brassicae]